ncbi:MAG: enoyl-CoA hydratase/isomerase family protein [Hyphomonas sp.]|uniref:enoyl-CoA hydratase/isomerase family protein n=1 Tax=Hyphomonas sp. TaxID=87 RepID=UPI00184A4757|nr:enoyl-CoA hydratase/isomerase family protein [Hyphomonas sp.]MBA3069254.1 enoyl-CoA hydratase/isomerase family protein [Hyphomonas sp.]MBU4061799.1 enoyl-CoA hydratase/isomerase family protein [Alphaproteobacteria bacterium]MBU4163369.1 enoyl-CoA hydratase/isomerase family protein [Alphaproteobacteria bacterium]
MTKPTSPESASVAPRSEDDVVLCEKVDRIATITLNRPARLNAINRKLIEQLHAAIGDCMDDDDVASIILTGAGRAFCAGDDLKDMPDEFVLDEHFGETVDILQDISRLLVLGPKPSVAAIRGWAVGGGLSWAINCDELVFADNVVAFFSEVGLGLSVSGGVTYLLPAAIGRMRARSLLMSGRRLKSQEALEYGLAMYVASDADLDAVALERAKELARLPANALGELKRSLNSLERNALEEALSNEASALKLLMHDMATSKAWPSVR